MLSFYTNRMMKKLLLAILAFLPLSLWAQQFGYMDYDAVLKQMPAYAMAQSKVAELKVQYQAEMDRSEEEFNRKYNEFLDGQRTFPNNILLKRQKELQGLYNAGVAFRKECQEQLTQAEKELTDQVRMQLNQAVGQVGKENNLEYILNTSHHELLYAGPNGLDITQQVLQALGLYPPV